MICNHFLFILSRIVFDCTKRLDGSVNMFAIINSAFLNVRNVTSMALRTCVSSPSWKTSYITTIMLMTPLRPINAFV